MPSEQEQFPAVAGRTPFCNRRDFLRYTGATVAATGLWNGMGRTLCSAAHSSDGAANLVVGKHAGLLVHNAGTLELETPLQLLREHAITPKSVLFVRNNQELPGTRTVEPFDGAGWTVEIAGLVEAPAAIPLVKLLRMKTVDVELVLQCSGNGRALFAGAAPVQGSPWTYGAMGNVRFAGVPLQAALENLGIRVLPAATFVTAQGKDAPASPGDDDFEHSIPLIDAMDRSLLALSMNGEPIPAIHGGPLRLVTPGYYGTMNIKWLSRLSFDPQESCNRHHLRRYRTPRQPIRPGSEFTSTLTNSEPNWRMRTKSVIFDPLEGDTVKAGAVPVRGVAWNDGTVRIDAVEVSSDQGQSWRQARLDVPGSPFAWYLWETTVTLGKGPRRIQVRAVDALGHTQPIDGTIGWNPQGYAWHGVHAVQVTGA